MKIKTTLIKANEPTAEGIIFPREVLETAVKDFQKKIKDRTAFFTNQLIKPGEPLLMAEVIGLITKAEMVEDSLSVEVTTEFIGIENLSWLGLSKLAPSGYYTKKGDKVTELTITSIGLGPPSQKKKDK